MTQVAKSSTTPLVSVAISARELAALLGISTRHVWRMNACGKLGPKKRKLAGSSKWDRQECMNWWNAGAPDRTTWLARKEVAK